MILTYSPKKASISPVDMVGGSQSTKEGWMLVEVGFFYKKILVLSLTLQGIEKGMYFSAFSIV